MRNRPPLTGVDFDIADTPDFPGVDVDRRIAERLPHGPQQRGSVEAALPYRTPRWSDHFGGSPKKRVDIRASGPDMPSASESAGTQPVLSSA